MNISSDQIIRSISPLILIDKLGSASVLKLWSDIVRLSNDLETQMEESPVCYSVRFCEIVLVRSCGFSQKA